MQPFYMISEIDHAVSQAMAAEIYLSRFCSKDQHEEYLASLMVFVSFWSQLKACRKSEEFIPSFF